MLNNFISSFFLFEYLTFGGILTLVIMVVIAIAIVLAGFGLSRLAKRKLFPMLITLAEKHKLDAVTILLGAFTKPTVISLRILGVLLAASTLFSVWIGGFITLCIRILIIVLITTGFWNADALAGLLLRGASTHFDFAESKTITSVLGKAYRAIVAIFAIIILMGEFNFEITGIITSLGIVGLTISLAAQDSASNLFAGLLILIERPFNIGDWVNLNGTEGTVEDITFRSTKIRALDNSLYVIPNANVSSNTINNGTNREKRMYRFTLGVTYDATRPQLEKLMADIDAMLKAHTHVFEDSVIVRLAGFGDSSIDLLISCYLDTVDMPVFLEMQNELHLNIMDIMAANNASFAFPSTSVYLEKVKEN